MQRCQVVRGFIVFVVCFLTVALSAQTVHYQVVPITSPYNPPGPVTAHDINAHGTVAAVDRKTDRSLMGFVWKAGKGTAIPTLGGTCSSAWSVNDLEHVAGFACLPNDSTTHAFLLRNGKIIDLDSFGGVESAARQVNNKDQVIGSFSTNDGLVHAFFWQQKQWRDLGFLGGSNSLALGINSSGLVTGQSDISNDPDPVFGVPHFHAFTWSNGTLTDLGQIFGSDFGSGSAVDRKGRVVGDADLSGDTAAHAFLWDHGTISDLSPYGDGIVVWAADINQRGDMVGAWGEVDDPMYGPPAAGMLCPCYAVAWLNGELLFLNSLVDPGWNLWLALEINNAGEITALGNFTGQTAQALLLRPIPSRPPVKTNVEPHLPYQWPSRIQRLRDGTLSIVP